MEANGTICELHENTLGACVERRKTASLPSEPPEEVKEPLIYTLMREASWLARGVGFEPNHIRVDTDEIRSEVIISGKGADGMVHEIQYSVTNPIYFEKEA
jgi:hypothetical protein